MKQFLLFLTCSFCLLHSFSQNRNNIWYFGDRAGINFNTNPPTALNNSVMTQQEGCATICDTNGQLLFYSNGETIWNRNHQVMLNGDNLTGGQSSSQSVFVVPLPGSNSIYYVFTVPQASNFLPLCYSILDMTLDGGMGAVTAIKNIPLHAPMMEKLTGTFKSNGIDYLIVVKELGSDAFLSYSLTSAGLDVSPVITHIGISSGDVNDVGYLRISPNRSKICIAYNASNISQLFDFDNSTGIISNPIDLLTPPGLVSGPYGIEFSPDNSKLYIMQGSSSILRQYDLLAGSPTAIQNSVVEIFSMGLGFFGGAIALGPDNKIYVDLYESSSVAYINKPDLAGTACEFIQQGILLAPGSFSRIGLPNNINSTLSNPCQPGSIINSNITICSNQSYQLPSGTMVSTTGIYHDTIRSVSSCDSIITTVNLSVLTASFINTNVQICSNQGYQLPSGTIVNTAGIYLDTLRSVGSCDSVITTVNLSVLTTSFINTNVQICSNHTYQLPSGTIVSAVGIYQDTIRSVGSCDSIITTVNLSVFPVNNVHTSAEICSNQTYQLPSGTIVNTTGFYTDTIRSVNSCDSIINSLQLLVTPVSFSSITDSIYEGESYSLPSGQTVNVAGVYQTVLINSAGCDSVITTSLKLVMKPFDCITLRNAFTPNGDGMNDLLILYRYICFKRMEVKVFNRYGQVVYESNDYKNDWDGKYRNKELPDGTYYYFVRVYIDDEHQQIYKNNITILR